MFLPKVDAPDALPILLRVYTDWVGILGTYLVEAFEQVRGKKLPIAIDSIKAIVEQLRKNADLNLLTVLIFDQYEEFFIKTDLDKRRSFYDFLRICLNIPFVKIIISLREDCLHYLLECERLIDIQAIENDILILKNRYPLANFSIQLAKEVIQRLTKKSHFFLDPPLIDKLVEDLAGKTGEVRPIELQIVGTQLQTHKITSLNKYNQFEEEEKLVQRFLKEIIKDCGASNESAAELVLYLLTSANGTRPIKTYVDLKAGLALESDKLDLVLEILVKSGLISLIQELYVKRYQLVHDYLVELIRNKIEFPIKQQLLNTNIPELPSLLPVTNQQLETTKNQLSTQLRHQLSTHQPVDKQINNQTRLLIKHFKIHRFFIKTINIIYKIINSPINNTILLTTIFILAFLSISVISALNQNPFVLTIIAIGWGVAGYMTAYQTKKQKEKILLQIQQQKENISQLQALLREKRNYTTETQTRGYNSSQSKELLNNRYKVSKVLGSGGFGYTYLAEDIHRPGKPLCVVKHLQPASTHGVVLDIARRLFKTEAEIVDILGHHEQIPQLRAYFEENQEFYLVQEYIEGHTLQQELTLSKQVSEAKMVDILKDVLQILVFVHSRGVIHRDIKPGNLIRRQKDQRLVLIDFGAVKQIQLQMQAENSTVAIGTAGYAPPEQFMGHPRLNSDIYALGMIGIQALTGTPVINLKRESAHPLAWRHLAEETSQELADILDKMVAFDFQKRYQSAEEVLKALELLARV